jgi:hypothetical protein
MRQQKQPAQRKYQVPFLCASMRRNRLEVFTYVQTSGDSRLNPAAAPAAASL